MSSRPQMPGWANKDERTYEVKAECVNCGYIQSVTIAKGTRVFEILTTIECNNCGCTGTLEKIR